MTKIYKLLIESPSYPEGTIADYNKDTDSYLLYLSQEQKDAGDGYYDTLPVELVENRGTVWELQEEKLDLRSPEAERMREEAMNKRWEFVPNKGDRYYFYKIKIIGIDWLCWNDSGDTIDRSIWNTGNCHRTEEEARLWGEKYARYFLTE